MEPARLGNTEALTDSNTQKPPQTLNLMPQSHQRFPIRFQPWHCWELC
jgi:hypothetical protein